MDRTFGDLGGVRGVEFLELVGAQGCRACGCAVHLGVQNYKHAKLATTCKPDSGHPG